jgi:ABC-type multidrug transport system ATPase subunit
MNQSFIDAIMHFMSLVFLPLPGRKFDSLSQKIREYVEKAGIEIDADECLKIYNSYSEKYSRQFTMSDQQSVELAENIHRQILADSGRNAQQNLYLKERFLIILALLEFSEMNFPGVSAIHDEIARLSENLNLEKSDFADASDFITENTDVLNRNLLILEEDQRLEEMLEGSWIEEYDQESERRESRDIYQRIRGKLVFRYFSRFNLLAFRFEGGGKLLVNNKIVYPGYFYSMDNYDQICFEGLNPIHPEEILRHFKLSCNTPKIKLEAQNLAFCYTDSENTVKPFSISEESGKLIGIIGNNGVGKSTILKLIAGHLKPSQGNIYVNDTDLIKENFRIQSVIGFVPHDDMIFPELSIYDNLLFQAQLSLGNLTKNQISERIEEVIRKFGLFELRDIRVKDLNSRNFSEYMRKCVNIAIEMLRNPLILCLDEPLTGLPYSDAKRLMNLLKEEVYCGKLVVMTVHLPTLEIYRFYDRIWLIDYDGHLIYSGEPKSAYSYLDTTGLIPYHLKDKDPDEVSPEEIINLIETRKIGPDGRISNERLIKPEVWYDAFRKKSEPDTKTVQKPVNAAPVSVSGIPGIEWQFFIYLHRNFKQLFNDWRSILIYLAGIPAVGISQAIMLKHFSGVPYSLQENIFLPLYIFSIVNYMMFSGLLTAADSIYKERKNVFRDYQINLSPFSYLNSKILFVFLLSLIQIIIVVLAGNAILEIKGMTFLYILTLFGVSAFANLLALNLSSAVRNLSSVYLLIPFILIPSIIYSGFLIRFDDYFKFRGNDKNIPLVAEFIPSRWAYEALIVSQFKDNKYNRYFFSQEFTGYQDKFNSEKEIPLLEESLEECRILMAVPDSADSLNLHLQVLKNEFEFLSQREEIAPFDKINSLNSEDFNNEIYENAFGYLTYLKFQIEISMEESTGDRQVINQKIQDSLQNRRMEDFVSENHNRAVENLVYGRFPEGFARIDNDHILKSGSPVFMFPESNTGRAALFSALKRFNNQYIDTRRFNLSVIWILNLVLYLLLVTDLTREFFNLFRRNKLEKY